MAISTDRDKVRLLTGDTDASDPLLYDDEVDFHLDNRTLTTTAGTTVNIPAAAADAAGAIAAKFSREFMFSEDQQMFDRSERVTHYRALEQTLRARAGGQSIATTLGGTASTS